MKVIHIVEKFFNSGALSCMNQINKALQLSEFIKNQEIICVKNNSNKKNLIYLDIFLRTLRFLILQRYWII